ncbi:MAG TPA: GAF domain-containing SpoIIE family protein phosphatase [Acidimicrobiales bacterium]|nr:GAF domain-containing SpoIIE family protein phosphatase [Acidimicrobiales bacterium]
MTGLVDDLDVLPESERSRLLQSAADRDRLERALLMLPRALSDYTPEHAIEVFAEAACEITGARLALVSLPESGRAAALYGPDVARFALPSELDSLPDLEAAFGGETVYLSDAARIRPLLGESALGDTLGNRELRSLLALPVCGRRGRSLGVLCLLHHRSRAFSERQAALGAALAAHLGHTIEVTDAVTEQTRISTALQESLLPPLLPAIPGLDLAARYRPSGLGNLVGGDFYDIFPTGGGRWSILLGDASGIGPEAAGLAGIARYTARALAESGQPPAEMLRQLNRAVLRAAPEGRFCTAALASFRQDGVGTAVSLASAGHPPVYLQRSGGAVEAAMAETGTILGLTEDAPIAEGALHLAPGEALVFYTDGVIEARDAQGRFFGEESLCETLALAAGRSAEGIARRIELGVLDHRGPRNNDDLAIVVARVPPTR